MKDSTVRSNLAFIPIAVLIAASAWAEDGNATGEAADEETHEIDEVIVTGTPVRTSPLMTPSDVDVLMGDEKFQAERASLGASLSALGGIDNISAGSAAGVPVIRGLSGTRTRILSNEIALDYQQYGTRHPPNVDPFVADRIEVVRGVSTILYGSDAIGGSINLLSRRPPRAAPGEFIGEGRATLDWESAYRQVTSVLNLSAAQGPFGINGTAVVRNSDGLVTPEARTAFETGDTRDPLVTGEVPFTDFDQLNGDINLGYQTPLGPVVLRWEAFRSEQNFVLPDPPSEPGQPIVVGGLGQDLENDVVHLAADLEIGDKLRLRPSIAWLRNLRLANPGGANPLARDTLPDTAVIDIERRTHVARLDVEHEPLIGGLTGRVGVEYQASEQKSLGAEALTPGGTIDRFALFALEERRFGNVILNAGLRYDYVDTKADPGRTRETDFLPENPELLQSDYSILNGSLGVAWRLTDTLSITGNVATGFRAPTIFELYVDGEHGGVAAVQRGDPTLQEETALSTDASVRWRGAHGELALTGYVNQIDDYVFLAGTGEIDEASGLPVFQVSQQDATLAGFDIHAAWRPARWVELSGTVQYVDGELDDGTQTPLLPPLKASAAVEVSRAELGVAESPFLRIGLVWADDQQSSGPLEPFNQFDEPPPPFGTASTSSYTLVNLHAGATLGPVMVTLGIENLFDEEYRDFLDTYKIITLGPGRNFGLRTSVAF